MEELVDVNVGCDIDDDIQENFEGNVEVEVQSMSNESSGACDSVSSDSIFDEWESEQLVSGAGRDEEDTNVEGYGTFATFVLPKRMVDFKWEVGTYFAEKEDIVEAIKSYALDNGRNIKFVKNDKERMRFKCVGAKGKCPWRLYCGYMKAVKTWQLRTMLDNHTCSREFNLKLIDSKWLSKKIEKTIRENPTVKGVDIREKVQRKYNIGISRPIIGLDGAFLKGKYGGELLTVVGRDGNEQMLPIAYCVVEVENKDSWRWFLELLVDDLGGPEICSIFTFISDQQKGLRYAIDELLPTVDQRFCVRHMYSNFRKKYPGKNLKRLMWRAATTTHPQTWEMEMRNIRAVNEDAYKHLIAIPPSWSRNKLFEVRHIYNNGDKFVVNIDDSSRTCRTWMMTGIPCCHSLATMKFLNIDGEKFIDSCYFKSTYEETYSTIIYPINGAKIWNITPHPDVSPPHKRVLPGRPKRTRRLEQWEMSDEG
ncbi:uncharacterized protein LOC106753486 [Vigna radiata var. radiata]|uniref:Uncharacterized protein LOC106753486 n=1 Tax=Vigna radiata var. radiata TaxID=3916 RepID=A0A1S3TAK0_VIGRR|nr:uncharacterized protein LOC106753486 [Vigna radiata var. radiata]